MKDEKTADPESANRPVKPLPHWRMIIDQGITNEAIENYPYKGKGTKESPFVVEWIDNDPRNPLNWPKWYKWLLTMMVAIATLAVSFASSAYSGGIEGILAEFEASQEVATLGLSLFVLGFALGPLLWAPFSELYGRQYLFFGTYAAFTFFDAGVAGSQNIWTIIILRFFAGSFGSSPLTNAGGTIADTFPARERGLTMSIFASAAFLGPALGPIIGGFMGETVGWRWVTGFISIFSGAVWILGALIVPETYAPVLLRRRAQALSKKTGKVYKSKLDIDRGEVSAGEVFKTSLSRPWVLLFREPIILVLSIYMAIIYGTLYMLFSAYPIVYQQGRGWSEGIGGLAFIGVLIGMMSAVLYSVFIENKRYQKKVDTHGGEAPPEARLPPSMLGGIALPIGLFWFAWTNDPHLPWAASVAAGIPFGFGMVLVFLSIMNYIIDAYTIFAASALAANSVLRSLFGATFPLFTTYMYNGLGIHWAATIPAFLALVCTPFPFLFYKYGHTIRLKCKYAAEADEFMRKLRGEQENEDSSDHDSEHTGESDEKRDLEKEDSSDSVDHHARHRHRDEDNRVEAWEAGEEAWAADRRREPRFEEIKTTQSGRGTSRLYDQSPYDIDRVNTRDSFRSERSRTPSRTRANQSRSRSRRRRAGSQRVDVLRGV